jgi:hypothetical protein
MCLSMQAAEEMSKCQRHTAAIVVDQKCIGDTASTRAIDTSVLPRWRATRPQKDRARPLEPVHVGVASDRSAIYVQIVPFDPNVCLCKFQGVSAAVKPADRVWCP